MSAVKEEFVQCEHFSDKGEGVFRRYGRPPFKDFSKFMVCPHGQGCVSYASADILRIGGDNFSLFCADVCYGLHHTAFTCIT